MSPRLRYTREIDRGFDRLRKHVLSFWPPIQKLTMSTFDNILRDIYPENSNLFKQLNSSSPLLDYLESAA